MLRRTVLLVAGFLASPMAILAQGIERMEDGPHGGALENIVGIYAEFLISDRTVRVYLYEAIGKPVASDGFMGAILVGSGNRRQVVQLSQGPANMLSGHASGPIEPDASMTLMLNTPSGQKGQVRF